MWSTGDSNREPLRVVVLAGGDSAEREISLASGAHCLRALVAAGHEAALLDPQAIAVHEISWDRFDACFIALHGGAGEDGRIQRRLELLNVPYTGSGPVACRLAMSKSAAKERFLQAAVPTPSYGLIEPATLPGLLGDLVDRIGFPLVIKPDSQGSSLGVSVVWSREQLASAVTRAAAYDDFLLLERYVPGREFTVAIVDRQPLPLVEIAAGDSEFFDYEAKYQQADSVHVCEPVLAGDARSRLVTAAVQAAEALGTRGLVRVDLMLDERGQPWVLELNAVPGMTEHSLAPLAASHAAVGMPALCDQLVRACLPARSLS